MNANTWERKDGPGPGPITTSPPPSVDGDWTLIYLAVGGIGVVPILVVIFVRRR